MNVVQVMSKLKVVIVLNRYSRTSFQAPSFGTETRFRGFRTQVYLYLRPSFQHLAPHGDLSYSDLKILLQGGFKWRGWLGSFAGES